MIRGIATLGFAALGVVFNLAAIQLSNWLRVMPTFPAFGGDDDFNLRATVYLLWVCPAFIAIGAVTGYVFYNQWTRNVRAWLGAAVATFVVFAAAHACAPWIESIDSRRLANAAAITLMVLWPLTSALGAAVAAHRYRKPMPGAGV